MVDQSKLNATLNWLIDGAPPPKSIEDVISETASRAIDAGIPLDAFVVNGFFIHPKIRGIRNSWTAKRGTIQHTFGRDYIESPDFVNTPLARMLTDKNPVQYHFDVRDSDSTSRYRKAYADLGYTGLLLLPLINVDGTMTGNVEFGTCDPNGFSKDQITALTRLQSPIARLKECFTERFDKHFTLATYVGRETSRKIFSGQIVLGDGEMISAVILFADLSGFTRLSNTLPSAAVLGLLNHFFAAIGTAVADHGGQILKFIGDGVLILFPTSDDPAAQSSATQDALAAISDANDAVVAAPGDPPISFRASLHLGDVFFGNIGSGSRLDFTAIGPAVNLASRMLEEASRRDARFICSAPFLNVATGLNAQPISCRFRGVDHPTDVFILDHLLT